jgi:hypothetical protein
MQLSKNEKSWYKLQAGEKTGIINPNISNLFLQLTGQGTKEIFLDRNL